MEDFCTCSNPVPYSDTKHKITRCKRCRKKVKLVKPIIGMHHGAPYVTGVIVSKCILPMTFPPNTC